MRDFQDVFSNIVDPVIDVDFAARWAKAGFAGEGNPMFKSAAWANVTSVSSFGVTAELSYARLSL